MLLPLALGVSCACASDPLPDLVVTHDNTSVTASCRVVVAPGVVIADGDGDGVLHVDADGVEIVFAPGTVLRGAVADGGERPDAMTGVGIAVRGRRGVVLRGVDVRGFKIGVLATDAPDLSIVGGTLSDNFRQHLGSTPWAEDPGDWLWPHENDKHEWTTNYGAAIALQGSPGATISGVRVRRGQNGIILDRSDRARVYDNDCSFLSGWGLAMWRSSDAVVSRNAFDFCVRGHSEGVYNRGQDSAGVLVFEQCSRTIFAENSATHGGDGYFCFAGKDAIGDRTPPPEGWTPGLGCNDNLLIGNDFSDAPAHGIEITFSRRNAVLRNTAARDGICGVWGGYSSAMLIADNTFEDDGQLAYGPERGGINIEHGRDNAIVRNTFTNNAAAVHLWWDDDASILALPGMRAGEADLRGNAIVGNTVVVDDRFKPGPRGATPVVFQVRNLGPAERVGDNVIAGNDLAGVRPGVEAVAFTPGVSLTTDAGTLVETLSADPRLRATPELPGVSRPVGARAHLAGRDAIVMDEWGPWDHESPLARPWRRTGAEHVYEFGGLTPESIHATLLAPADRGGAASVTTEQSFTGRILLRVRADRPGLAPYVVTVDAPGSAAGDHRPLREFRGTILRAAWECVFFGWASLKGDQSKPAPPRDADMSAWRALAEGVGAVRVTLPALELPFKNAGPSQLVLDPAPPGLKDAALPRDYFGLIAHARVPLTPGRYVVRTTSDDGVRVLVNDAAVISNWTHHGPTRDDGTFEVTGDAPTTIGVEYCEIAGFATLSVEIEPAADRAGR